MPLRAPLVALLLLACSDPGESVATSLCGWSEREPRVVDPSGSGWPCWVADDDGCVATVRDVGACDVPESSDAMLHAGDTAHVWCEHTLGVVSGSVRFVAVQCETGERVNE